MPVPKFFEFLHPTLNLLADGKRHKLRDIANHVALVFQLSDEDCTESLDSGQSRLMNRVGWSVTYLSKAGLTKKVGQGTYEISPTGLTFLQSHSKGITLSDLEQFPEYLAFKNKTIANDTSTTNLPIIPMSADPQITPEEAIEGAFGEINQKLADDLIEQIKKVNPHRFEAIIVDLMLRLGYGGIENGSGIVLGRTGDEGVDGVINEDKLGLDKIYLQAKRYTTQTVGSPQVQAFAGALAGKRANKGVFVTTSQFSNEARRYAENVPSFTIVLIDGPRLAQLMIECNIGVAVKRTYDLKRIDLEFFAESE